MTPKEALLAIKEGVAGRLMLDWLEPDEKVGNKERIYILAPASVGHEGVEAPELPGSLLMAMSFTKGRCTFLSKDRKCEIHKSGFKPLQCRMAFGCDHPRKEECPDNYAMARMWDCDEGRNVVKKWKEKVS